MLLTAFRPTSGDSRMKGEMTDWICPGGNFFDDVDTPDVVKEAETSQYHQLQNTAIVVKVLQICQVTGKNLLHLLSIHVYESCRVVVDQQTCS